MITEKKIDGGDLGEILLKNNPRARHYSIRIDKGTVCATLPKHGNMKDMMALIDEQRPRIKQMLEANPKRPLLDEQTDFSTPLFRLDIVRNETPNFFRKYADGLLTISCPANADLNEERIQNLFWKVIEDILRHEAKKTLPQRVATLAARHGFTYHSVKINNSRTHWGSCSTGKNINLSLSLMLLPGHLIDYVLLHELCHTKEMNHCPRFWTLMDKTTNGMAHAYREELKAYRML